VNNAVLTCPQLSAPLSASAAATVTGNYTVKIAVYNESGELVKEILMEEYSQPIENIRLEEGNVIESLHGENNEVDIYYGTHEIGTWDGTNRNGDLVTNGDYYIKVDNIDTYGVVKTTTQKVLVNRAVYRATVNIYNEAGEIIKHLYVYMDDPGLGGVLSMQLSTSVIKPSLEAQGGTPNSVAVILSNGTTVVWDGRSDTGNYAQSGQYFIEVHTVDGQGAQSTVVREVSVIDSDAGRGIERVLASPNLLNEANGYKVTFTTKTAIPLTLKASIYTLAGELVGTIQGRAGTNSVIWDGGGVVSGLYLAVVEMRDANGGFLSQQTKKIAVIH
jgi:flagellar hook assembly protein FlgD